MRSTLAWAVGALGAMLCAAGVVVFVLADRATVDFGWSAYAPLPPVSGQAYQSELILGAPDGWTVLWFGGHLTGALLVFLGLLVLAGLGGWLLGRRTAVGKATRA
jgi:hypothetical protein